jgi:hypothetical protein
MFRIQQESRKAQELKLLAQNQIETLMNNLLMAKDAQKAAEKKLADIRAKPVAPEVKALLIILNPQLLAPVQVDAQIQILKTTAEASKAAESKSSAHVRELHQQLEDLRGDFETFKTEKARQVTALQEALHYDNVDDDFDDYYYYDYHNYFSNNNYLFIYLCRKPWN